MIDSHYRTTYQKICVDPIISILPDSLSPIRLTMIALLTGLTIPLLLFFHFSTSAFIMLLISGYCDTLDGTLARKQGSTSNLGACYDIVSDRIVETCIIIGLFLVKPEARALSSLLMLGSAFICVTSFLVVGIFTENTSKKSFYYSSGIVERAEAFAFFAAMILFPGHFWWLSLTFALLTTLTAVTRIREFARYHAIAKH